MLIDPVSELALEADEVVAMAGESCQLFSRSIRGEGALACLERLQGRLGEAAVQVLAEQPDYRPECATRTLAPGAAAEVVGQGREGLPLWLLPTPQYLSEQAGRPQWHGPLKLLTRGERLESGWWDGGEAGAQGDVRRDYFVARNPAGQMLWIYRDSQGWYCHGLFA